MISRSGGQCGKLHSLSRVAGLSTPMTGIDRSKLSCRTLLFLFVLLAAPMAARCDTLEDSARDLAGKIAVGLPTGVSVSFEVRNISSLQLDEFNRIRQALTADLQNKGVRTETTGSPRVSVVVTLSENVKSFVWTAEIHYADTSSVVLTRVPRPRESRIVAVPIKLRSEKFWEGPQNILDAMIVNSSSGESLLLLLTPVSLLIRKIGSDEVSIVQIPATEFMMRDPAGGMTQFENKVTVRFLGQICSIDLDARTLTECHPPERPSGPPLGRAFEDLKFAVLGPMPDYLSGQIAPIEISCRTGPVYVSSGSGDYTKPDTVRLFESDVTGGIVAQNPLSDILHFAGPVMALISNGATPRAIVRNLETGNYEAYRFSITCAQ
jgi:hypothetical protein